MRYERIVILYEKDTPKELISLLYRTYKSIEHRYYGGYVALFFEKGYILDIFASPGYSPTMAGTTVFKITKNNNSNYKMFLEKDFSNNC